MTIEERAKAETLLALVRHDLRFELKPVTDDQLNKARDRIVGALQAERDDMKERAAKVVESHLDVNSDAVWDLIKEIKDLK